ncbi:hypothetical protein [Cohnella abietis]|uniref:Lipoprotein n=1 Tax=Cohnella abietis TaxID=2507935 RepID=A0A3T1D8J2_9BACL|nr:hypothetical protein [Cohnella abietis]BBI34328.1 hypothetical protein KCTCHS21_37270 [Cohnella abietis]
MKKLVISVVVITILFLTSCNGYYGDKGPLVETTRQVISKYKEKDEYYIEVTSKSRKNEHIKIDKLDWEKIIIGNYCTFIVRDGHISGIKKTQ